MDIIYYIGLVLCFTSRRTKNTKVTFIHQTKLNRHKLSYTVLLWETKDPISSCMS